MHGRELRLDSPLVMAILNVTPDSFSDREHLMDVNSVTVAAARALQQGAEIIDIGGCSTRPKSNPPSEEEELRRVRLGVTAVRTAFPDAIISVDTFRAHVAEVAVSECGADIVNDVTGGLSDPEMFATVARLKTPYILTHTRISDEAASPYLEGQIPASADFFEGRPAAQVTSSDDLITDMMMFFRTRIDELRRYGVEDIILDPGYGFGKSLEQNYEVLRRQRELLCLDYPILAGISHKSMIYKPLNIAPQDTVNGTTALHMVALMGGASILRVHEVKEAKQTIELFKLCQV